MIVMSSSIGTRIARGSGVGYFRSFHVTWAAVSSERGFHKEHNNYFIHIFTETNQIFLRHIFVRQK